MNLQASSLIQQSDKAAAYPLDRFPVMVEKNVIQLDKEGNAYCVGDSWLTTSRAWLFGLAV